MVDSIGRRLILEREARSGGRTAALEAIDRLLDREGVLRLVYLSGPAGAGKSALLEIAAARAERRGHELLRLDAADRPWTPATIVEAAVAARTSAPRLVLVDSFEAIAHAEDALRDEHLPRVPDDMRILAAGRVRLGAAWRDDAGWRALACQVELAPAGQIAPLGRVAFAVAVRDALRRSDRPDLLRDSPLAAAPWLAGRLLADALREECRRLFASPRDAILDRLMELTYFRPAGKQEVIAAQVGLAYSTYRRHLAAATKRLIDAIWAEEVRARQALPPPAS